MIRNYIEVLFAAALLATASLAQAGAMTVTAERLLTVGDDLSGSTVSSLNVVFTDGEGRPGSLVELADTARVIWYDGAAIFNSLSISGFTLSGGEATMGVGNGARFIYSPNTDGGDSVWTQSGLLFRANDPAPGIPDQFTTFHSRPKMLPDGTAVWIAGITDTNGGSTQGRALYRANSQGPANAELLLRTGDLINGVAIGPTGVGFQYQLSDNGDHLANLILRATGSTANDGAVLVDGVMVAQEGSPVGPSAPGENHQGFAGVAINNQGNWLLAGDTDGPVSSDAFLAYNGDIQMREGSSYGGEDLPAGSALRAIAINNINQAVMSWNTPGNVRKLFFATDASQLFNAVLLLKTGSGLDFTGNGVADATLIDIFGSFTNTKGLDLAEDGRVMLHVSYEEGGQTRQSLISIQVPDRLFSDRFENAN